MISLRLQKQTLALTGFFLFVLIFRLYYGSQLISFSQDVARDVMVMQKYAQEGRIFIPYGAKTSVGNFSVPPFHYQLHYFLSVITDHSPLTMHWFTIFVESLTPVVLILFLSNFIDRYKAFWVAALYATSPLVTVFGTTAWNPGMIPFFSTLSIYFLFHHLRHNSKWSLTIATVLFGLAFHLHFQLAVLIPFFVVVFLRSIACDRKNLWYWGWGVLINILFLLPYFYAEYFSNWSNTKSMVSFLTVEHSKYFDSLSIPFFIHTYIPAFLGKTVIGEGSISILLGRLLLFVGLPFLGFRAIGNKKLERWLLLYLTSVFAMLRIYKGDKHDYYLSTLIIFPFILMGLLIPKSKKIFLPVFYILFFLQGIIFSTKQPNNQLNNLKEIINTIVSKTNSNSISIYFHDMTLANPILSGFYSYSEVKLDKNSNVLVDVCNKGQRCFWNGLAMCQFNKAYTFGSLLKYDSGYVQSDAFILENYFIVLGRRENTHNPSSYFVNDHNYDEGTDLLSTDIINYY